MRKFKIEQGNFILTSTAGLGLVGQALHNYSDIEAIDCNFSRKTKVRHSDVLKSYIGLLCQGKNDFEAISNYKNDPFFQQALGLRKIPSAEWLRQRMDKKAGSYEEQMISSNVEFLSQASPKLTKVESGHIPVDIDCTLLDNSNSKKEGVCASYKRIHGYMPIACYFGTEGYCLDFELRPGNRHCQSGTEKFLEETTTKLHKIVPDESFLYRLDGAFDAAENMMILEKAGENHAAGIDYIIRWNPRTRLTDDYKEEWCDFVTENNLWDTIAPGIEEVVLDSQRGRISKRTKEEGIYRHIIRLRRITKDENGQLLLFPKITVEGWWTSLKLSCAEVIKLYDDRGTSEQFHSEFKTDLDIERLPSGNFATNSLVLRCAVLAFNILRWIGQEGLIGRQKPSRSPAKRRRIKTIMQHLMYVAAFIVKSSRRLKIKFGKNSTVFPIYKILYEKIAYG